MKKILVIILAFSIIFAFSACTKKNDDSKEPENKNMVSSNDEFTELENGNIVSPSGIEYSFLANEDRLYYFGELDFEGSVSGEDKTSQHLSMSYQTGMFSIKDDKAQNILIRHSSNSEWFGIYRKSSLPPFDFSADNCIRLELVLDQNNETNNIIHTTCGDGITDKTEISKFLSDVRSQKNPREAGLYDLVTKPDGMLENCYRYAVIYGFFEDEPNLAICMPVTSFNDLAYSVTIDDRQYVLPEIWIEQLQNINN